jgi:lysophospholipase L1-like esterase
MSKKLAIVGNLLIAAISIAFALTVVEVALRITDRFGPVPDGVNQDAQLFRLSDNEEIIFEHVPNVRVEFPAGRGNPGWQISTDENALRRNGNTRHSTAEIRGICIGDSIIFGAGLSDHETIPARLSAIVSKEIGRSFECLNFGVSNYTTEQEAAYFRHKQALRYEPKIVVIGLYTNDFKVGLGSINLSKGRAELLSPDAPTGPIVALSRFRVAAMLGSAVGALNNWLRERGLRPRANEKPLKPGQIASVERGLDQIRADLAADGIPMLIVLFPRDWQLGEPDQVAASPRQQWAKGYCERNQIICIDLLDHYFGKPTESYFRGGDDSHPHAKAANEIAELVAGDVVRILSAGMPPRDDRESAR